MVNGGTYSYEYHLKDHLGNTRVVYSDANNNGSIEGDEILQVTDYYPFGMRHEIEGYPNHANQKYLYNGKELQEETGWYDYGARMYDASLGRWHVIDNLAEDYISWSPYQYVMNNPLKFVDPDGNGAEVTIDGKKATMTVNIVLYPQQGQPVASINNAMANTYSDFVAGETYTLNVQSADGLSFYNPNSSSKDLNVVFNVTVMDYDAANEAFKSSDASQNFFGVTAANIGGSGKNTNNAENNSDKPMVNTGEISVNAFTPGNSARTTGILAEEAWHTTNATYNGTAGDHNTTEGTSSNSMNVCAGRNNSRAGTVVTQTDVDTVSTGQNSLKSLSDKGRNGWDFYKSQNSGTYRAVNGQKSSEENLKQ